MAPTPMEMESGRALPLAPPPPRAPPSGPRRALLAVAAGVAAAGLAAVAVQVGTRGAAGGGAQLGLGDSLRRMGEALRSDGGLWGSAEWRVQLLNEVAVQGKLGRISKLRRMATHVAQERGFSPEVVASLEADTAQLADFGARCEERAAEQTDHEAGGVERFAPETAALRAPQAYRDAVEALARMTTWEVTDPRLVELETAPCVAALAVRGALHVAADTAADERLRAAFSFARDPDAAAQQASVGQADRLAAALCAWPLYRDLAVGPGAEYGSEAEREERVLRRALAGRLDAVEGLAPLAQRAAAVQDFDDREMAALQSSLAQLRDVADHTEEMRWHRLVEGQALPSASWSHAAGGSEDYLEAVEAIKQMHNEAGAMPGARRCVAALALRALFGLEVSVSDERRGQLLGEADRVASAACHWALMAPLALRPLYEPEPERLLTAVLAGRFTAVVGLTHALNGPPFEHMGSEALEADARAWRRAIVVDRSGPALARVPEETLAYVRLARHAAEAYRSSEAVRAKRGAAGCLAALTMRGYFTAASEVTDPEIAAIFRPLLRPVQPSSKVRKDVMEYSELVSTLCSYEVLGALGAREG